MEQLFYNKTCWDCGHMDPREDDSDEFYCNELNRWFKKQTEDDACSDFVEDYRKGELR